jgi:glycosyltransferase involved in cell wall biosynthesis
MKVLVNINLLLNDQAKHHSVFAGEAVKEMTHKNQEHEFIFLTVHKEDALFFSSEKNVTVIVKRMPARHPLLWKWWHDIKLPALLKKYKADVYVSFNGFCSLNTMIPQCVLLHDLSFAYDSSLIKKSHLFFYRKYLPKFLRNANAIGCSSLYQKNEIINQYGTSKEKTEVVYLYPDEKFRPINEDAKEQTRMKYTDGKNFFLHIISDDNQKNLIILLKAFSVFKKRQKSNWKLALIKETIKNKSFEILETYKYRDDMVLLGNMTDEELVQLTASAYAFVDPFSWNGLTTDVLQAMKCNIPVIVCNEASLKELTGGAGLYADPNDEKDIADKMMLLYKDESFRNNLIDKEQAVAAGYSQSKTAEQLWRCISKAGNANK